MSTTREVEGIVRLRLAVHAPGGEAAAYDGLAFAARRNAAGTWSRASLAVERAEPAFRDASRSLALLGYRIAA